MAKKLPAKKAPKPTAKPRAKKSLTGRVGPETAPNIQQIPLETPEAAAIKAALGLPEIKPAAPEPAPVSLRVVKRDRYNGAFHILETVAYASGRMALRYSTAYVTAFQAQTALDKNTATYGPWQEFD
jgi:hypothetical protein